MPGYAFLRWGMEPGTWTDWSPSSHPNDQLASSDSVKWSRTNFFSSSVSSKSTMASSSVFPFAFMIRLVMSSNFFSMPFSMPSGGRQPKAGILWSWNIYQSGSGSSRRMPTVPGAMPRPMRSYMKSWKNSADRRHDVSIIRKGAFLLNSPLSLQQFLTSKLTANSALTPILTSNLWVFTRQNTRYSGGLRVKK